MELIQAQYANNILLIIIVLLFAVINILAWSRNGIFIQEWALLKDTHNERTFSLGEPLFKQIKPLVIGQYYLFFGLCLFTIIFPDSEKALQELCEFNRDVLLNILICIAIPFVWFLLQFFFFRWVCYIFGGDSRIVILQRIYNAAHMLAGPLTMVLFLAIMIVQIPPILSAILLTAIFIITQIIFIFSGIKIFLDGFGSLCVIFVYLCALEIAPLLIIYSKIG